MLGMLWRISALLPVETASRLGALIMVAGASGSRRSAKARRNFRIAFPDKRDSEIASLVLGMWNNFGRVAAELPHLVRDGGEAWSERVEIVGAEHVAPYRASGRACIFISAHLANWDLLPWASVRLGVPLYVTYAPLKNPMLDRLLLRYRDRLGCMLAARGTAGTRALIEALRKGNSIGLLVDRKTPDGVAVPFFGRDATTSTVPARLALRFACPLIPVHVERVAGARFRVILEAPLEVPSGDKEMRVLGLTNAVNAAVERWIRARPEQWFCSNRRWPKHAAATLASSRSEPGRSPTTPPAGATPDHG